MKKILIVEDEPDIQELLCAYLRNAGYAPSVAGDGVAAPVYLIHITHSPFDYQHAVLYSNVDKVLTPHIYACYNCGKLCGVCGLCCF